MYATPENMRKCEEAGIQAIAFSPITFEECSATAGDYFYQPDGEPLLDEEGHPMILVRRVVTFEEINLAGEVTGR